MADLVNFNEGAPLSVDVLNQLVQDVKQLKADQGTTSALVGSLQKTSSFTYYASGGNYITTGAANAVVTADLAVNSTVVDKSSPTNKMMVFVSISSNIPNGVQCSISASVDNATGKKTTVTATSTKANHKIWYNYLAIVKN